MPHNYVITLNSNETSVNLADSIVSTAQSQLSKSRKEVAALQQTKFRKLRARFASLGTSTAKSFLYAGWKRTERSSHHEALPVNQEGARSELFGFLRADAPSSSRHRPVFKKIYGSFEPPDDLSRTI